MKKRLTYKVAIIVAVIVIAVLTPLILGQMKIRDVELQVYYPDNTAIITQEQMMEYVINKYGTLTQYKRRQIKTGEMRQYIEQSDFVDRATVNVSLLGDLRISIYQRDILARLYDKNGKSYYIDKKCNVIDAKHNQPKVKSLIVNGNIRNKIDKRIDTLSDDQLAKIYTIVNYIHTDNVLKEWLSEMVIGTKDIRFMPIQGNYQIISDTLEVLSNLEKLHYLYEYSFKNKGWDDYESIDLRYHNQIVCKKFSQTE